MAWADTTSTIATAPRIVAERNTSHPGFLARLWDQYRAWRARRDTVRILYSLDEATLRDLGVSPRSIEALVYGDNRGGFPRYDEDWWRH